MINSNNSPFYTIKIFYRGWAKLALTYFRLFDKTCTIYAKLKNCTERQEKYIHIFVQFYSKNKGVWGTGDPNHQSPTLRISQTIYLLNLLSESIKHNKIRTHLRCFQSRGSSMSVRSAYIYKYNFAPYNNDIFVRQKWNCIVELEIRGVFLLSL